MVIGKELSAYSFGKKKFDICHSGCHQGPISAEKRFAQNKSLPMTFFELFLAPIKYQDLFSKISKIWAIIFLFKANYREKCASFGDTLP